MWMMGCTDNTTFTISDSGGEQRKRDLGFQVSSRWNPTPEQISNLEDLYRRGMRTPTAEQIQYITAQLRRYGKIEGKNVFYWFQNHKARESQKRRKRIEAAMEVDSYFERNNDSAPCWIGFEQAKNWVPTNCSCDRLEEPISYSRSERAHNSSEKYCMNSLQFYGDNIRAHCHNINREKKSDAIEEANMEDRNVGETSALETLELFPLHSDAASTSIPTKQNSLMIPAFNHSQFFQFLPLKN